MRLHIHDYNALTRVATLGNEPALVGGTTSYVIFLNTSALRRVREGALPGGRLSFSFRIKIVPHSAMHLSVYQETHAHNDFQQLLDPSSIVCILPAGTARSDLAESPEPTLSFCH